MWGLRCRPAVEMVRLLYKAALVVATAAGAVAYTHTNPPWISSLRAVRFGRAAYAISLKRFIVLVIEECSLVPGPTPAWIGARE